MKLTTKQTVTLFAGVALFGSALFSHADVYRCVDANGQTVFSDTWCETETEAHEVVDASGGLSNVEIDGLTQSERALLRKSERRNARAVYQRDANARHESWRNEYKARERAKKCQRARDSLSNYKRRADREYKAYEYNRRKQNQDYYKKKIKEHCG